MASLYTNTDEFHPEIWSPRINAFMKAKLVAAKFFDNYSDEVAAGGDIVHIPGLAESVTVSAVSTNSQVTAQAISDTGGYITISSWSAAAIQLSDKSYAQAMKSYNLQNAYAMKLGYALSKTLDTSLVQSGVSGLTPTTGATGSVLTSTAIEKAFGIIESRSIPKEECMIFMHPKTYWNVVLAIQKFYDASQFGKAVIQNGVIDTLYGVPVIVTPQVKASGAGYINTLVHKSAVVYALGNLPGGTEAGARLQIKESEHLYKKIIADLLWGSKVLNATYGVKIYSK